MGASDPDVLRAGTNHIPLPGGARQQQRIHAVTWDLNGNEEEDRSSEEGGGRDDLSGAADGSSKGKEEKGSGRFDKDSLTGGHSKTSRKVAKTSAARQETTEGQEAIRLTPGHALGRTGAQQEQYCEMYLVRAYKFPEYK
ncbi:hypothetical protein NDU88_004881 [Pleurodeles waltl]|uniref:Uncharacterized protein n=1 Tax=Pleurodeles waltl TaxID=8319 RepID=A0AAV7QJ54_PLEWA|nr:hypothetical protein NDU88_004881 [Pleurodeles waltl]